MKPCLMSTLPHAALSQVRNHRIITIPPLTDLIVLCAICDTVRRKDVRSRRYVQEKVARISTFWWFSVLNVELVFASKWQKNTCSSAKQFDPFHIVTEIMQSLAYQRHLLTADPASVALRCRNTALDRKRTAKTRPAAAFTYGTNCLFVL